MTSDNTDLRKHNTFFWVGCLVVVSFGAGFWAAFTPAIGPFIKWSAGVLMILAGLLLLSPFATSRPTNEQQRKVRMRISVMGGANIVYGIAQMIPSVQVTLLLTGLTVLLLAAAAIGFPKRLFLRRR